MLVWTVTFTIEDEKGSRSTLRVNVPYSFGAQTAFAYIMQVHMEKLAQKIDAMTTGYISAVTISLRLPAPIGTKTQPATNSDVEEVGAFNFLTDGGYRTQVRIPAFSESFIVPGTSTIDTAATEIQDFVDHMVNGMEEITQGGFYIHPSDRRGDDIVALWSAHERFKSRKG